MLKRHWKTIALYLVALDIFTYGIALPIAVFYFGIRLP
jgi:hypothetical protein